MTNEELEKRCDELQERIAVLEIGCEYEGQQRESLAYRSDSQFRDLSRQLVDAQHDGWRRDDKIRDLTQRIELGRRF